MGSTNYDAPVIPAASKEQPTEQPQIDIARTINQILESDEKLTPEEIMERFDKAMPSLDSVDANNLDLSNLSDVIKAGVIERLLGDAASQAYHAFKLFGLTSLAGVGIKDENGDNYLLVFGKEDKVLNYFKNGDVADTK